MRIYKLLTVVVFSFIIFVACDKEKEVPIYEPPPLRDYATQYNSDIAKIENYLKTHSVNVTNNAGFPNDQDATFASVPNLDPTSIWGSNPTTPQASLLSKIAVVGGVNHKIYYVKFRPGVGSSPMLSNRIKAQYKGFLIENDLIFDSSPEIGTEFPLNQLILGWQQVLPEFKMGTITNSTQYADFGAGIMFLPSALAYYNQSPGLVPAYSPLAFSIKLFNVI